MSRLPKVVVFAVIALGIAPAAYGTTRYVVFLNTGEFAGTSKRLAFHFVSGADVGNVASVLGFEHDGILGDVSVNGGPVYGGLVAGLSPADARIGSGGFYNTVELVFDSLGMGVSCGLDMSETAPMGGVPDQLSFLLTNSDGATFPFITLDPLGTNALFSIAVTGLSGGELSVFAPMEFVPPDTIRMTMSTTDVNPGEELKDRLKFSSVAPNPSRGGVGLFYEVPEPGGLLRARVFDIAGRLIAEPFYGVRAAGTWSTYWDGTGLKGFPVPVGIYIVHLQMAGQSLVRRVVIAR